MLSIGLVFLMALILPPEVSQHKELITELRRGPYAFWAIYHFANPALYGAGDPGFSIYPFEFFKNILLIFALLQVANFSISYWKKGRKQKKEESLQKDY